MKRVYHTLQTITKEQKTSFFQPINHMHVLLAKTIMPLAFILFSHLGFSQQYPNVSGYYPNIGYVVHGTVVDGDTIPNIYLNEVPIYGLRSFKSEGERRKYNRLVKRVKKAYPYAKICENRLHKYEAILVKVSDEKTKKKIMKQAEEDIKKEFYKDIQNLTFSEGVILLKLIDRQTGQTSYALLQEFRGNLRAMFWQGVARLFGANLKSEYDGEKEDYLIEEIVQRIERGDV